MYNSFEKWVNPILADNSFAGVKAFNFNLYEDYDGDNVVFNVQMIGAPSYDADDSEWACEEIFSTGENLFRIPDCDDWEICLELFGKIVADYLAKGKYADVLMSSEAVAYGFVDGDLEIAYQRN